MLAIKRRRLVIGVGGMLGALAGCIDLGEENPSQDKAVDVVETAFIEAVNDFDIELYNSLLHPDGTLTPMDEFDDDDITDELDFRLEESELIHFDEEEYVATVYLNRAVWLPTSDRDEDDPDDYSEQNVELRLHNNEWRIYSIEVL